MNCDIKYVGVNDLNIDLFESQYKAPNGISYNSYVINDKKIAVMDSVDVHFADEWIDNIKSATNNLSPDFLIIQHMEPDHSSSIMHFLDAFPSARLVSSIKSFSMMRGFFGKDFTESRIVIDNGDSLSLGKHRLNFLTAPMVHWPEVIVSYDSYGGALFSADAFGKFGALNTKDDWASEARRYYFGIVGKYGCQVQSLLNKTKGLNIKSILPLHGPIIDSNIDYYVNLYNTWSTYTPECDGVCIAYASIYGNTKDAALLLEKRLADLGVKATSFDLTRCDMYEAVASAFKYDRLVLASATYNGGVFPSMREFINNLVERNFQNRKIAFIENGSWAPCATRVMKCMLTRCKNLDFYHTEPKIISALNNISTAQIEALARELR